MISKIPSINSDILGKPYSRNESGGFQIFSGLQKTFFFGAKKFKDEFDIIDFFCQTRYELYIKRKKYQLQNLNNILPNEY